MLIAIIKPSSMIVTVLIGKLKTAPKHAHWIFFLFSTVCNTPIILADITTTVTKLVTNGLKLIKKDQRLVKFQILWFSSV